jgi:hypothetical protein
MKFSRLNRSSRTRNERGSAVIVILALVSILLVYTMANMRSLYSLGRELKLLDQRQTHHWQTTAPATNNIVHHD